MQAVQRDLRRVLDHMNHAVHHLESGASFRAVAPHSQTRRHGRGGGGVETPVADAAAGGAAALGDVARARLAATAAPSTPSPEKQAAGGLLARLAAAAVAQERSQPRGKRPVPAETSETTQ